MRNTTILACALLLGACTSNAPEATSPPANRWADERLWPVLEAQEHRDTPALCAFLNDSSGTVRYAAALAFASVQDSASRRCLLTALADGDAQVRAAAAHALTWVADSAAIAALIEVAAPEPDSATRRAMYRAGFIAEMSVNTHDATWLIGILESDVKEIRLHAAQRLARSNNAGLVAQGASVLHAARVERDPDVRPFLVAALRSINTPEAIASLQEWAARDSLPAVRISAIRALGFRGDNSLASFFIERLKDGVPGVRDVAVEQLQRLPGPLDGDALWKAGQEHFDERVSFPLYGLVMRHGSDETKLVCRMLMRSLADVERGPYLNAALLTARAQDDELHLPDAELMTIMLGTSHPAIRQAAFTALSWRVQRRMMMPRAISSDMQVEETAPFWKAVFGSGDPGLISAAAEQLSTSSRQHLEMLFPSAVELEARQPLHPIRDLEALQLLDILTLRRDGAGDVPHVTPPFNHPIDRARLIALPHGQRYRIRTAKGEVIIATDVNECPGSSLAFDSLVTAGYYNGKSFHRVVPNFVAQGGCPRGDGYGGMPWTLRTEIGTEGFATGAVGLASAGRDTESCQFFIMLAPAPHLDGRYTRFAHVVEGMDVVWQLQVGDVIERVERID